MGCSVGAWSRRYCGGHECPYCGGLEGVELRETGVGHIVGHWSGPYCEGLDLPVSWGTRVG